MRRPKYKDLYYVEWIDCVSLAGGVWHSDEDVRSHKLDLIYSVGWLVKEDKDKFIMASHKSSGELGGDVCIPQVTIKKKIKLEVTQCP